MPYVRGADSGGTTTAASKPKAPVYSFNGRTYSSYSAYMAARAAYQAQAEKLAQQRKAAAAVVRRAAEARKRAELLRRAAATQRQREELQRRGEFERRRQVGLLEARRKAAAEAELAKRRHAMWQQIHRKALTMREVAEQRAELMRRSHDANEMMKADQVSRKGGLIVDAGGRTANVSENRSRQLAQSGDYANAVRLVRAQAEKTGGQYFDSKLLEQASKQFQSAYKSASDAYQKQVDDFYSAFDRGDYDKASSIAASEAFLTAQKRFIQMAGDGRKPGELQQLAGDFDRVAELRDAFISRAVFSVYSGSGQQLTDIERKEREALIQRSLVRQGARGKMEMADLTHRITRDQFFEEQDRLHNLVAREQRQRTQRFELYSRKNGIEIFTTPDGKVHYQSRELMDTLRTFRSQVERSGVDIGEFERLVERLAVGGVRGDTAQRDLNRLLDDAYAKLFPMPTGSARDPLAMRKVERWNAARESWKRTLFGVLGRQLPEGLGGLLFGLSDVPLLGPGLRTLGHGAGAIGTLVRMGVGGATGGGQLKLFDVDLAALLSGDLGTFGGKLVPGVDTADATKGEYQRAGLEMAKVLNDPDASLGDKLDAIDAFGADFAQGNTKILADLLTDPTSFVPVGRFLALAKANAGLRGGGSLLRGAGDAIRGLTPDFGGISRAETRRLLADDALARQLKISVPELRAMSDEALTKKVGDLLRKAPTEVDLNPSKLVSAYRRNPQSAQQLVSAVEEALSKGLASRRVTALSAEQVAADVDYAVSSARRAEAEARLAAEEASRLAGREKAAVAAGKVRRATGSPVTERVADKALAAKREQIVASFRQAVEVRAAKAREAVEHAELLRTATKDTPVAEQRVARQRLSRLVRDLRALDDEVQAGGTTRFGLVSRRRQAIEEFDRATGGRGRRTFAELNWDRLRGDFGRLRIEERAARGKLRTATGREAAFWRSKLRRLADARSYYEYEREILSGGRAAAKRVMHNYVDRVVGAVQPKQVAYRALTKDDSEGFLARDINRLVNRAKVRTLKPGTPLLNLSRSVEHQLASAAVPVDWGDRRLRGMVDTLSASFADVDLATLLRAVSVSVRGDRGYLDAYSALLEQASRHTGVTVKRLREVYDVGLPEVHRVDVAMGLRDYQRLDKVVADAISEARHGFRAKSSVRLSAKPRGGLRAVQAYDRGLIENVAKIQALTAEGADVAAYDAARAVLRDPVLRHNTGQELREQAGKIAATGRQTREEAFDQLRMQRVRFEARNQLERFATRPEMAGLSSEEIVTLFELSFVERELVASIPVITDWQAEVLRRSWEELTNTLFDDPAQRNRVLRGAVDPPEGMRLADPSELPLELGPTPVFVAPSDHPELAGALGVHRFRYGIVVPEGFDPTSLLHEYAHAITHTRANDAVIQRLHAMFAGFSRDDLEVLGFALDEQPEAVELVAELWARWKAQQLGITPERSGAVVPSWSELRSGLHPSWAPLFDEAEQAFELLGAPVPETYRLSQKLPPFGNRAAMHQWMIDQGHWSPRQGDAIRRGERVLSITEEREFWESWYGYTPPWTEPDKLERVLTSPHRYRRALEEWGFFDDANDFEKIAAASDLQGVELHGAMAFGAEGVERARTFDEMRRYFTERYGDVVVDANHKFTSVPWLMTADEYRDWVKGLTPTKAGFEDAFGVRLDPTLVQPKEVEGFVAAVSRAVERQLDRLTDEGVLNKGDEWLAQEQMQFAYDMANHLLVDPVWRGSWFRRLRGKDVLGMIGTLMRLPTILVTAFPIMNIIDARGPKRFLLAWLHNGGRPLSVGIRAETKEVVRNVDVLGLGRKSTWYLSERNGLTLLRDSQLSKAYRARAALEGIGELPLALSQASDEALRLDFARAVYQRAYDDLIGAGVSAEAAKVRSLAEARRLGDRFFPSLAEASEFEKAINQLVPFFTYNYRNKLLGVRMALENPWMFNLADAIGDEIERANVADWERQHPGVPIPDELRRRLILHIGGTDYTVDLSTFSDWTRGASVLFESNEPEMWAYEFFRVPHPGQVVTLAALFGFNGGKDFYGREVDWRDITIFGDVAGWLMGHDGAFDPNDPKSKDAIQILSQLLFFKSFGRVSPMKAVNAQYFALLELDPDAAKDYLKEHPALLAYWLLDGPSNRVDIDGGTFSWYKGRDPKDIAGFEEAQAGYERLKAGYDAQVEQYYLTPWSAELRALRKERRLALAAYLDQHPELAEAWGYYTSAKEWATEFDGWITDSRVDKYFALQRTAPKRADFDSDLAYAEAFEAYRDQRRQYLEAFPDVYDRLFYAHNEVERAWYEQELHWEEIVDRQAKVRLRIAQENVKADPDRDLLDVLYTLSDANYRLLDAEGMGQFYDLVTVDVRDGKRSRRRGLPLPESVSFMLDRVKNTVVFPGRADFFYEIATPAERREIEADGQYAEKIGKLMDSLGGDPTRFWDKLQADPALLAEYLARNPDRKTDFAYVKAIREVFRRNGRDGFWDGLLANKALLNEYLRRNPEKRATYQRVLEGKRYYRAIQKLFKESSGPSDFFAKLERDPWLSEQYYRRHPERLGNSRYFNEISKLYRNSADGRDFYAKLAQNRWLQAEYFRRNPDKKAAYEAGRVYFDWMKRWVDALGRGDGAAAGQIWASMPAWVKERYYSKDPARRQRATQGAEYSSAMGQWVELLKARKYAEADKFFGSLPEWMQQRYFAKHPDQRAKHELDGRMLQLAADYLLASGPDKARILERAPALAQWLTQHGGNEAAYRGLIFAIYRALPASNEWLRRTFRERYPEYFSKEAQGERRLRRVAEKLAENPELEEWYYRALDVNRRAFEAQLRRGGTPPKPLTMERRRALRKRQRRRHARYGSHAAMHREGRRS